MGTRGHDQEHGVEPAQPPLTTARAREMTAGLREAMDDVRRSVSVLAARIRDAHAARVWLPLGHSSCESCCRAEFGISRAQAYRLLDVARALAAIHGAVTAGTKTSRTPDIDPGAAAALDSVPEGHPHRLAPPNRRRRTRPSPRCTASSTPSPPAPTRWGAGARMRMLTRSVLRGSPCGWSDQSCTLRLSS
ncbi:hypothetical protein ACOBQB_10650 [Streptomyces sp. G5(2025)]|uniref:hypothetical protein n=1 Tax=Streptomyces sp. G5(2025) TaxID=3406628 RepID=UPI003C1778B0